MPALVATDGSASMTLITSIGSVAVTCSSVGVRRIEFLGEYQTVQGHDGVIDGLAEGVAAPLTREVCQRLSEYFAGGRMCFEDFPLDFAGVPAFRQRVLAECRRVPYGRCVSYAELAVRAGSPAAVRAVGSAMSHNPIPIIIPCHRVLRSDGSLGGFSAPGGVNIKRCLLALEGIHLP